MLGPDLGPALALEAQDLGVSSIDVAPGEVGMDAAGEHDVVHVIGVAEDEPTRGPKWHSIGLAQELYVGVKHSSTLWQAHQARILLALWAERLSRIT
jgi:hypothetical protein